MREGWAAKCHLYSFRMHRCPVTAKGDVMDAIDADIGPAQLLPQIKSRPDPLACVLLQIQGSVGIPSEFPWIRG